MISKPTVQILLDHIPSKSDIFQIVLLCIFPTHVWGTIIFFHQLPSYLLKMKVLAAVEIYAYALLYNLVESLFIAALLLLVCMTLPARYLHKLWVPQSAVFQATLIMTFLPIQFQTLIYQKFSHLTDINFIFWVCWMVLFFGLAIGMSVFIRQSHKVSELVYKTVERVTILSWGFLILDGICVIFAIVHFSKRIHP